VIPRIAVLTAAAALAASAAGAVELVVHYSDGPQEAAEMVEALGRLRTAALTSGLDLTGHYRAQFPDFQEFVASQHPAFALVDAVYFLEHHATLEPLLTPFDRTQEASRPYCLVAAASAPWSTLEELGGKSLAVTPIAQSFGYFVSDFLLEGSVKTGYFRDKPVSSSASALKALELGEADAAFVPCSQVSASAGFKQILVTRPVPFPVLVAFPGASPELRGKLRQLFLSLDEAAPLCSALQIQGFRPVPPDYAAVLQAFRDNPVPTFDDLRVGPSRSRDGEVTPSAIAAGNVLGELRTRLMPPERP
jgi:hypothetical protein